MADKDFKVKTGLDLPAPLPVVEGGTGQTTVENTRNALMPAQTGHSGKFISTDGTAMSWAVAPQQTATDGAAGYKVYAGNTTPTGQNTGDIWIDGSTGNGIQLVRWRKTIASATSTVSGLDDNNLTLTYTAGNEQVYINGTLITRGQDYTATNGTSVILTQAAEIGDTVEIFGNPLFSVTDVYTQAQSNSLYVSKAGFDAAGKNLIINGAFDFWQRGTSFTGSTTFSADRWFHIYAENISRQSFSSVPEIPGGIYFLRWIANQVSYHAIQQKIENGAILMSGQQVTLSFWARSNTSTSFNLYAHSNLENDQQEVGVNFTITPTWTKYTATLNIPVTNGTSTTRYLRLTLPFNSSTHGLDLAQVQMEIGPVPTLFSRAGGTIAGELVSCQRYFIRYPAESIYTRYGVGLNYSTTLSTIMMHLPVEMRVFPSIGNTGTPSNYAINHGADVITALTSGPSLAGAGTSKKIVNIGCGVASGLTAGSFGQLISNNNLNSYIDISAEL